jgi:hypothetical protein
LPSRPTFYFILFLSLFFVGFGYLLVARGNLDSARVSPEPFAAHLISLALLQIEYNRVSSGKKRVLENSPAIVGGMGFLSSISGILSSTLGVIGSSIIVLLLATLISMVTLLYFKTEMVLG